MNSYIVQTRAWLCGNTKISLPQKRIRTSYRHAHVYVETSPSFYAGSTPCPRFSRSAAQCLWGVSADTPSYHSFSLG
ncbi:hypothetical protein M5D96_011575 [Drosophila gunungcola]|uniref:Uncharacterized protein n=1 Tax=Drosophila gunungcola TaxID=103775 RepID=A0A9Q0BKL7_9MUSC|nr:hypothetical protein M5D96_011575 [Drosophila gunungcola]